MSFEDEDASGTEDFADSGCGADTSTGGPITGGGGASRGGGAAMFVRTTSCGWLLTLDPGGESLEPEPESELPDGVPSGFIEGRVGRTLGGVPGSITGSITGLGGNDESDGRGGFEIGADGGGCLLYTSDAADE